MRARVLAALLLLLPGPLLAVGDPQVGEADPQTEHLSVIGEDIRIGARLLFNSTKEPAANVEKVQRVLLEVGFLVNQTSHDRPIRLHCRIRFVQPSGVKDSPARDSLCFEGQLADLKGKWTILPLNFRFKPQKGDPNGTWGVEVAITDEETAEGVILMPTYRWTGGAK